MKKTMMLVISLMMSFSVFGIENMQDSLNALDKTGVTKYEKALKGADNEKFVQVTVKTMEKVNKHLCTPIADAIVKKFKEPKNKVYQLMVFNKVDAASVMLDAPTAAKMIQAMANVSKQGRGLASSVKNKTWTTTQEYQNIGSVCAILKKKFGTVAKK